MNTIEINGFSVVVLTTLKNDISKNSTETGLSKDSAYVSLDNLSEDTQNYLHDWMHAFALVKICSFNLTQDLHGQVAVQVHLHLQKVKWERKQTSFHAIQDICEGPSLCEIQTL